MINTSRWFIRWFIRWFSTALLTMPLAAWSAEPDCELAARYYQLASMNMQKKETNDALLYIDRGLGAVNDYSPLLQLQKQFQDRLTAKAEFEQAESAADPVLTTEQVEEREQNAREIVERLRKSRGVPKTDEASCEIR